MPYYLGIDGGGTKTTCAVGDDSKLLATATTGPSNVVRVGESRARESLQECVRQSCAIAGIAVADVTLTCVGASGATHPEVANAVRTFLAEILSTPVAVVGDMEIALEAAFGTAPGVIVIAGTGSIAYGRDQNGATARAGGWGFAIGDEGSAHWIGRDIVSAVLRTSDANSGKADDPIHLHHELVTALFKVWGVTSLLDLARIANSVPPPDFSALFPVVAASGDVLAVQVLSNAGLELANTAAVVTHRLFSVGTEIVPVAMIGGVFRHAELTKGEFCRELCRLDPRVQINPNVIEPVEGALWMARRVASTNGITRRRQEP